MAGINWNLINNLGNLAGNMATASYGAKKDQNSTALDQFRSEISARLAQSNNLQDRASDIRTAPGSRLAQSAKGNLVNSWTPTKVDWGGAGTRPVVTGGIGQVGFDAGTKNIASNNMEDALKRSEMGWASPDITPVMTMPESPTMSKSSFMDKLLGAIGAASGVAKAVTSSGSSAPTTQYGPGGYGDYGPDGNAIWGEGMVPEGTGYIDALPAGSNWWDQNGGSILPGGSAAPAPGDPGYWEWMAQNGFTISPG